MSDMRIGGLASGMDIDKMVNDLMKAERMPLQKMEQDQKWMTWKRDAYREMNTSLFNLDQMALDLKMSDTFQSKSTSSSNSAAVTATANTTATEGNYNIQVERLATAAINVSDSGISKPDGEQIDPDKSLSSQADKFKNPIEYGEFEIVTYNEDGNPNDPLTVNVTEDMSLNDVLGEISDSDIGVRAFYNTESDKVVLERTETGNFNQDSSRFLGAEIGFNGQTASFLSDTLQVKNGNYNDAEGKWELNEDGGQDAKFTYNNALTIETHNNQYNLNGVTFNFHNTTATSDPDVYNNVKVSVTNNTDHAVEKITKFVEKYNEVIEKVNGKLTEDRYRDYKPLTDKQKEEMDENEIELWNEKAKSGLLRSDSILSNSLYDMRSAWYGNVDTGSKFSQVAEVGIETTSNYLDGGKLTIDEDKLRNAINEDPEAVQKLFNNDVEGESRGILNRLEDSLQGVRDRISERAGKGGQTLQQYTMGRRLDDLNDRISAFEDRLVQVEDRYWSQFTEMEKAIQRMNSQSNYLMQQFG
ncbi:flagellar hook-associated protein 2 [Salinibacillus aidingensis]|uniref:Flagellar hook-associated protein 2 n=1 Tax=Salinibacillus aidingensis TaxID=237684 RepID=A0ABN1BJE4_9BACI